jgi:hypothetical protein
MTDSIGKRCDNACLFRSVVGGKDSPIVLVGEVTAAPDCTVTVGVARTVEEVAAVIFYGMDDAGFINGA